MRRLLALLLVGACLLALPACRKDEGGDFRFPLAGEPSSLDPQLARDEAARTVIAALFEGLCTREDGAITPAAATWTVSEDGLCYTFSLREGVWSDGAAVTADDFLFAYERTADIDTFAAVDTVTAVDSATLQVTLRATDPTFLSALADGGWYPCRRAFFAECGGGYGMERDTLVTNGPFTLQAWNHDYSLLLYRFDDHRTAADIAPRAVRFVIGAEESAAALQDGSLDACRLAASEAGVQTVSVKDTLQYLWFNTTVTPLTSAAVRCALRDAIAWEAVTPLLGTPTASFVSPAATVNGQPYTTALSAYHTAVDRAAFTAALTEAGATASPTLTLLCEEGAESLQLAQYIVQSWQKNLGVYFSIEQVSAAALTARLTAGNYHLAIASATARGSTPADALRLFAGDAASGNWSRFADAVWEATLDDAVAAEEALYALCPAVPLAVTPRLFGIAADVQGVTVQPFSARFGFFGATRR